MVLPEPFGPIENRDLVGLEVERHPVDGLELTEGLLKLLLPAEFLQNRTYRKKDRRKPGPFKGILVAR